MAETIADHIKMVVFDHDDTLVGTIGTKWAQHKHVARTYYDKELSDEEIALHWGKPLGELVCLLYGTNNVEEALAFNTACHKDFPKELFMATVPTLNRIKAAGKLLGVVTATSRFSFEHDLDHHKISRELLDYTQAADDTPAHKPDPAVFDPLLKWVGSRNIKPDEVLYVGDGLHDMKAALGAGFDFIGVETGLVTAAQFREAGARSIADVSWI